MIALPEHHVIGTGSCEGMWYVPRYKVKVWGVVRGLGVHVGLDLTWSAMRVVLRLVVVVEHSPMLAVEDNCIAGEGMVDHIRSWDLSWSIRASILSRILQPEESDGLDQAGSAGLLQRRM